MRKLGLTGGIASGKSKVGEAFAALGCRVLDADALARRLTAPGEPLACAIVAHFGASVADARGALDRRALRERIFRDPKARAELNALTHPPIMEAAWEDARRAQADGAALWVLEAALLVETGLYRTLDALIVVDCAEETQIGRLMARDGVTREAALAALAGQSPRAARLAAADYVIENEGTLAELGEKAKTLIGRLAAR